MTDIELLNKINEQINNPNKKFDENLFFSYEPYRTNKKDKKDKEVNEKYNTFSSNC